MTERERERVEGGVLERISTILTEAEKNWKKSEKKGDYAYRVPKSVIPLSEWITALLDEARREAYEEGAKWALDVLKRIVPIVTDGENLPEAARDVVLPFMRATGESIVQVMEESLEQLKDRK